MPIQGLDDFAAPLQWAAFDAADMPSGLIALAASSLHYPHAVSSGSMAATIGAGAAGHVIRRTMAAIDLSDSAELAVWVRGDQRIGTDAGAPVRLRVGLGSAALPVGDAANLWHRYIAVPAANSWAYQRFNLDDLAPAVRSGLTSIALTVASSDVAVSVSLAGLEAHRRTLFSDCEAALTGWLHNQLTIGGNPVPAVMAPDTPVNAALPHYLITRVKSVPNGKRALGSGQRSDFTDDGYRVREEPEPWDLFYAIDARAATAAAAAQLQEFFASRLTDGGWLPIGNRAWRMELVDWQNVAPEAATADPRPLLRISAWQDSGSSTRVRPADQVVLNIGAKATAGELVA